MAVLNTLAAVVVGGLLATATSAAVTWYTQKKQSALEDQRHRNALALEEKRLDYQAQLERTKDARALRDAKRERLRAAYVPVLEAAQTFREAAFRIQFLYEGETDAERDSRIAAVVESASAAMGKAIIRLKLEADATSMVELTDAMFRAFRAYMSDRALNARDPGSVPVKEIHASRDTLLEKARELEAIVRQQLAELEQPIGLSDVSHTPSEEAGAA